MKSLEGKRYVPALGFKYNFAVNVKESRVNEDVIRLFYADGICIEEQTQISIIGKEAEADSEFKKCDSSEEYVKYYNN